MDIAGQHFFTGTTLTGNHHCGITGRHFRGQLEHAFADRILSHRLIASLLAASAHDPTDRFHQNLRLKRLDQIIDGTRLHGRHRVADLAVRGNQHHGQPRIQALNFRQQLMAGHAGHIDIADHHIDRRPGQACQRIFSAGRFPHLEFRQFQRRHQSFAQVVVIFHNQNLGLCHAMYLQPVL